MESALLARGFHYGSAPGSVVIGWNGGHAAVTLPDGTPVSSGESGSGVRIGGGGAYQPQFSHHMYLPVQAQPMTEQAPQAEPAPPAEPAVIELAAATAPVEAAPGEPPVVPVEGPIPDEAPTPTVDPAAPAPAPA